MNNYIGGYGIPSLESIVSMIGVSQKKRQREEFGITSINGFEGIERLGIPHKYMHIEIGGKYLTCLLNDKKTVYTTEGACLFECTDFRYYKQGMFLVGKGKDANKKTGEISDDFGYALYNEGNKITEPIFKPCGILESFNESGFTIVGLFGKWRSNVVINKLGEIAFQSDSFDSPYLKGIICQHGNEIINLLTGNVICKKTYSSGMDTHEFMFVQVDSNCIYQINKNNGDFIIHGEIKKVEEPKVVIPKAAEPTKPKEPEQRRNDQCNCGSGKKFKNCCLNT